MKSNFVTPSQHNQYVLTDGRMYARTYTHT